MWSPRLNRTEKKERKKQTKSYAEQVTDVFSEAILFDNIKQALNRTNEECSQEVDSRYFQ